MTDYTQTLDETVGGSDVESQRVGEIAPLEGISNNTFQLVQEITWETATDWDNAVSESGVVHEAYGDLPGSDVVVMGYPSGFQSPSAHYHGQDSSGPLEDISGNSNDATESGSQTYGQGGVFNATSAEAENTGSNNSDGWNSGIVPDISTSGPGLTISVWVYPVTSSGDGNNRSQVACCDDGGYDWSLLDESGNWHMFNTNNTINSGISSEFNAWNHIVARWDTDNNNTDFFYNGSKSTISSNLGSGSTANDIKIGFNPGSGENFEVRVAHLMIYEDTLTDTECQNLYFTSSSLTTATKSASAPVKPDLQNLSYSLNGQTITLDVIGSPGTAEEEIQSQTLDGATGYNLSWSSGHQNFRIKINLSTSDPTVSPTVSRVEIK